MTSLDPKGGLAAAEIAFFGPSLIISAFIVFRHGFSRRLGWFYLVMLSLLRLIGASTLLYAETQDDYSTAVLETIYITSAVGTAPLLLALLGFLQRVHDGMKAHGSNINAQIFRGISLLAVVSLVLAIIGGVYSTETNPGKVSTGHSLMKAASVLFLAIYLILAGIAIFSFLRKSYALMGERKLVDAAVAALPFLLVRVVYTVIVSFSTSPSSIFYFRSVNVYVSAFMQFLMEAFTVVIFIVAGLLTPKREERPERDMELASEQSRPRPETQRPNWGQQQPKSLGDYRPSRLIRNAVSGR